MIDSLSGIVQYKEPSLVVIACGGVGYGCKVSLQTAATVGSVGEETTLLTHLAVREDEISLYGFSTRSERICFLQLLSVSGVGPKAALSILSDLSPDRFALAVAAGDYKVFTKTKGVGPKLAQRIVLELKDKVSKTAQAAGYADAVSVQPVGSNMEEAMAALMVLGYGQSEVASVLSSLDPALSASELIRLSLMQLGKQMFG